MILFDVPYEQGTNKGHPDPSLRLYVLVFVFLNKQYFKIIININK